MNPMSLQDVFNKVWERAKIKVKSTDSSGGYCLYRNPDGSKNHCFVGVCIPDELYQPIMDDDGMRACDLIKYSKDIANLFNFPGYNVDDVLTELQSIHDLNPIDSWNETLREFATKYNLTIPE